MSSPSTKTPKRPASPTEEPSTSGQPDATKKRPISPIIWTETAEDMASRTWFPYKDWDKPSKEVECNDALAASIYEDLKKTAELKRKAEKKTEDWYQQEVQRVRKMKAEAEAQRAATIQKAAEVFAAKKRGAELECATVLAKAAKIQHDAEVKREKEVKTAAKIYQAKKDQRKRKLPGAAQDVQAKKRKFVC